MDIRNNASIFIAKDCARTATVQITDPATTATYYGPGEIVITNTAGTALTTATALKSVPEIMIHGRSASGKQGNVVTIKGSEIVKYSYRRYVAPQPQAVYVDITEFNLTDFTYSLHFTSDQDWCVTPHTKSVSVPVGKTAKTKLQLATAFVDKINNLFGADNQDFTTFRFVASLVATDKIKILAVEDDMPDGLNLKYRPQRFTVQANGYEATITDNKTAALTSPEAINRATKGVGTYFEVAEAEKTGRGFAQGRYGFVLSNTHLRMPDYDVEVLGMYEANGTTLKRYDEIVITWVKDVKDIGGNHPHGGAVILYLPVEDNDTNQVGVATTGIVPVLNKYIVTEYGVGSAFTIS